MNEQNTCRGFESNLNAYLDGELDREARERMNQHARACPACGQKLETMTRLLTMCAELDEGLTVPLEAQAAWRSAVRKEAGEGRRVRRTSAWTRSVGWIAAALTFLTVSTAVLSPGGSISSGPRGAQPLLLEDSQYMGYSMAGDYGAGYSGAAANSPTLERDGAPDAAVADQVAAKGVETGRAPVVLRSASRIIETTAYDTDSGSVDNLVDEYAAYYESDSQSGQPLKAGQGSGRERDMMIRVPGAQLDEFLAGLDVIGTATYKNQTAQDISSDYYDASARLDALKAQRDQLNKLMSGATDLAAVVSLADKFYEIQAEIDSMEGRIRGWDSEADYARVSVHLSEAAVRDQVQPVGDSLIERIRTGFFDSVNWLSGFLQDMTVTLAALAPILVILIPVVVLIIVIVKVVRKRKRR